MGVGIAGATSGYSVAHGVLDRLPVDDGNRVVAIEAPDEDGGFEASIDWRTAVDLERRRPAGLEGLAGHIRGMVRHLGGDGGPGERLQGEFVTPGFFDVLGVSITVGRGFVEDDVPPGSRPAVVLAHDLWERRFGSDPAVLDRPIVLDGESARVVGVAAPEFDGLRRKVDVWVAGHFDRSRSPELPRWHVVGRLPEGVGVEALRDELGLRPRIDPEGGVDPDAPPLRPRPLIEALVPAETVVMLRALVALGFFVLAVACGCVTVLLLARALRRAPETAIRLALGAPRGRLVGEQLLELGVLAILGGLFGVSLTYLLTSRIRAVLENDALPFMDATPDLEVLVFAVAASCLAAVASGLLPGLRGTALDIGETLNRSGGRGSTVRMGRAAPVLVLVQVVLSCALVVVAALQLRQAEKVVGGPPPFRIEEYVQIEYWLPWWSYRDVAERTRFHLAVLDDVRRLSGVADAAFDAPPSSSVLGTAEVEDASGRRSARLRIAALSPGALETLDLTPVRGRSFEGADSDRRVVVVDDSAARRLFGGGDVVGNRIRIQDGPEGEDAPWLEIVGVVPSLRAEAGEEVRGLAYVPSLPSGFSARLTVQARAGDPVSLFLPVAEVIRSRDPEVPVEAPRSMVEVEADRNRLVRVGATLFTLLGGGALILAVVGIHGTVSYAVRRRRVEMAIRAAMGAGPARIAWVLARGPGALVATGTALGVVLGAAIAPYLGVVLLSRYARDPLALSLAPIIVLVAAAAAVAGPLRRALASDVMDDLRVE